MKTCLSEQINNTDERKQNDRKRKRKRKRGLKGKLNYPSHNKERKKKTIFEKTEIKTSMI